MDIALIKILLFGFPGILGYLLYNSINGVPSNRKDWEGILNIFVFSVLSYTTLDLIVNLLPLKVLSLFGLNNCSFNELLGELENSTKLVFKYQPMIALTLITIVLVYLATFIINKKIFNHFAVILNLTKRIGGENLWEVFHDTYQEWVIVRDFKNKLIYFGYIEFFSDTSIHHEIIMTNVTVYTETSDFMYRTEVLYLSREHNELNIEIHDYQKKSNK